MGLPSGVTPGMIDALCDDGARCRVCDRPRTDDSYWRESTCDGCGKLEADCDCKRCPLCGEWEDECVCEEGSDG